MLEVLLLAQLSCSHLSNYVITPEGECIDLSPVFHDTSTTASESFTIDGVNTEFEDIAFEDDFISALVKRTDFYSFSVYITNNHPSRRIVPTRVTYELIDSDSVPFYTGTYSTGEDSTSIIGIAPTREAPTLVVNDSQARIEHRTTLRDEYSVNILNIEYDLGYEMNR